MTGFRRTASTLFLCSCRLGGAQKHLDAAPKLYNGRDNPAFHSFEYYVKKQGAVSQHMRMSLNLYEDRPEVFKEVVFKGLFRIFIHTAASSISLSSLQWASSSLLQVSEHSVLCTTVSLSCGGIKMYQGKEQEVRISHSYRLLLKKNVPTVQKETTRNVSHP